MLKNNETRYGLVARALHWVIGLTFIGMLAVGLYMEGLPEDAPNRMDLYGIHKAVGFVLLWAVVMRICWTLLNWGSPKSLETHKRWEVVLAKIVHGFLYLLMLGLPLTGWAMSSGYGYPVHLFGMEFLMFAEKDMELAKLTGNLHEWFGKIAIALVVFHVVGALKHRFIDKDGTLARMICGKCCKKDQVDAA